MLQAPQRLHGAVAQAMDYVAGAHIEEGAFNAFAEVPAGSRSVGRPRARCRRFRLRTGPGRSADEGGADAAYPRPDSDSAARAGGTVVCGRYGSRGSLGVSGWEWVTNCSW
ncbi:hypothetical protein GCM10010344_77310 [Streptomyces bluensis]|nr:hypothetical protein GCM10010344_77310 [Streptomyces bluensis]